MKTMKQISSGAEASIFLDKGSIVKQRLQKSYRIPEIDETLRNQRTKKEAKIMNDLSKIIPVPKLLSIDQKNHSLIMQNIEGTQLKQVLDNRPELAKLAGTNLALMHDNNMIHGDLTTSNMILAHEDRENRLYFIDFGLSFNSSRVEDKAVDIHLFKQALESKHFRVNDLAYKHFLKGYTPKDREEILRRLETVESRGRYKEKF